MPINDVSDRDGYMADPASDVDSSRNAGRRLLSDGDAPTSPLSSDGMVRPPKVCPSIFGLLQQIESSDDDVSRRVAQAACDSDTSDSDHAADNEDGSVTEESMRSDFLDSMATELRSVQSDESVTSANSDGSRRNGSAVYLYSKLCETHPARTNKPRHAHLPVPVRTIIRAP
jgi:hypothetical protein